MEEGNGGHLILDFFDCFTFVNGKISSIGHTIWLMLLQCDKDIDIGCSLGTVTTLK